MPPTPANAVLLDLDAATDRHPLERKLLVCRSMGEGRELLRALAARRSWIGWAVTTPRRLAMELAAPRLAAEGLAVADAFEEEAAVDAALDAALSAPALSALRGLGEAPGFRRAVANAVAALRLAGVDPGRVRGARSPNPAVRTLLARVLDGYLAELADAGRVDAAEAMARALEVFRSGDHAVVVDRTWLAPGLSLRGSTGRLVTVLMDHGATPVRTDPVHGQDPPAVLWAPAGEPAPLSGLLTGDERPDGSVDLFAASGPASEVREVLRRVMEAGLRWDEVEIVATDPVVYGGALHALAERLEVPVSYAVGLPVERTRTGRAAAAYFRWIQDGFSADVIRRLLENGDLRPPGAAPPPARLGRRLRSLRIGHGRPRYLAAFDRRLRQLEGPPEPRRAESAEQAAERVDRERSELEALRSLLSPIIAAAPHPGVGRGDRRVSPARIASGLHAFLQHVAPADEASRTARDRLLAITDRVAATLTRETDPGAAIARLRRHLEIRVPAPAREGSAPWVSSGGHIHLSDLDHGGYAARRATFVVGLDADRFPGAGLQDPMLLDSQRRALDPDGLPTSADRLAATRFRLASCLARLRGTVTLSYSAWDPTEAREVAPSSVLLQAYRSASGRPKASFEELRAALGEAASPVPSAAAIDAVDLWFEALEEGGILREGSAAVLAAHPRLEAGARARAALAGEEPTPYHGLVRPRPELLDPRLNESIVLSASGLEDLGSCALRYFYRYALGIRPPDDPELDPDVWLGPLDRGGLLHAVYEAVLREAREHGVSTGSPRFEELALEVLDRESERYARLVPPPGEAARVRQLESLRADVRAFCDMVSSQDDAWEALELRFGFGGEPRATLELKGGAVAVRGAIDRIDRTASGLVVIDYKTGRPDRFERRHGTFNGGRRLQNAVYAAVARALLGDPVDRMEYHFPTRRGRNEVIGYGAAGLRRGLGLIDRLLAGVAAGRFLPTEEPKDCTFCDYAPICRHTTEGYRTDAPLARWAGARFAELPEYRERRDARSWDDTFLAELESDAEAS